jgi:parallel beta-helix repeat protein
LLGNNYVDLLGQSGAQRLITKNWEAADSAFAANIPSPQRQYAYYKVKDYQNLDRVAQFFSVDASELAKLNPGQIVAGTTIKVPPVEKPLDPISGPNGKIIQAQVVDDNGLLRVKVSYKFDQAVTTIPELMNFLKPYNAIKEISPKVYRIERAFSLEDNIRIDITDATVTELQLRSSPNNVTCLCLDSSMALVKNIDITSIDPITNEPDKKIDDQRSFVRAKAGRLDIVNSRLRYLGNALEATQQANTSGQPELQREGGVYGVSWRIGDGKWGEDIATGWVEGSTFFRNHFGAFSFGASGMMWKNNRFADNDVYGLDPHDDSNNAWVEGNVFEHNGKHGFIVSKRCNYNVIRNNVSYGNKLHGFMLHEHSDYNVIENNVAYDNVDNFVIYGSSYNVIRNNTGYNARSSQVRVNQNSNNNYMTDNKLYGGSRGIYLYGNVTNAYMAGNEIRSTKEVLTTNGAHDVFFAHNSIDSLGYKVAASDRLIFGINNVKKVHIKIPVAPTTPLDGKGPVPTDNEDEL